MKNLVYVLFSIPLLLFSCNAYVSEKDIVENESIKNVERSNLVNHSKRSITTKYKVPNGFKRVNPKEPFGIFLNNIPLKSDQAKVKLFDGSHKTESESYVGILDLPLIKSDNQKLTNLIYRLRAEYFFKEKKYKELDLLSKNLEDTLKYSKYPKQDHSHTVFLKYIDDLLNKTTPNSIITFLKPISIKDIQIGDVLIQQSTFKSNAVIVMDLAENEKNEKLAILAYSPEPSQDIQIISNLSNPAISPWYSMEENVILTPEWRFLPTDAMRFD